MIHTGEFLDGVEKHLQEAVERGDNGASEALSLGRDQWIADLSATLPSDFSVPVTQAATQDPEMSIALAHAVEDTMCDEFAESIVEIDRIKVLDHGDFAEVVVPDVRPVRAVILAAVLSLFFAVVLFLLVEISQDSIWLPATLRRRYGLNSLGTVRSVGFAENLMYTLEKCTIKSRQRSPKMRKSAVWQYVWHCRKRIRRKSWRICRSWLRQVRSGREYRWNM